MRFNLTTVADTVFGKFLSCALMANPEHIAEHDLSSLNIEITLDGRSLDFQQVFSEFERQLNNGGLVNQNTSTPESLAEIRGAIRTVQMAIEEATAVNNHVSSNAGDLIDAVVQAFNDSIVTTARQRGTDAGYEHSPSDSVNYEVTDHLENVLERLQTMESANMAQQNSG
tara:strand:- start:5656 stop:6165 length:510 start_codon:yes stop_codon:yes gene_type:complete